MLLVIVFILLKVLQVVQVFVGILMVELEPGDFDSNESVVFSVVPSGSETNKDTGSFGIDSSGNLSIMFDGSGSEYNFNSGNVLSGSVTVTNALVQQIHQILLLV